MDEAMLHRQLAWKVENCHNPDKGWIVDGADHRISRLGNRNAFLKLVQRQNHDLAICIQKMRTPNPTQPPTETK